MGKSSEREVVALDHFFAGAGGDRLGKELAHLGEHGQHFDFVEKALRRLHVHEGADAVGDFVERVDVERQIHAARGAELVDEELRAGVAFDVLKQQRRPASSVPGGLDLADAVGDLGDFEDGVGFGADFQFAGAVERRDPVAQVVVGQACSRKTEDYTGGNLGWRRNVLRGRCGDQGWCCSALFFCSATRCCAGPAAYSWRNRRCIQAVELFWSLIANERNGWRDGTMPSLPTRRSEQQMAGRCAGGF